ncbi:MAG: RNA polymerase sigma factor [Lachnospiraceae bacterium]|nr:RNA polymerase sigma factor [Lachnospiraceae bacterium]MDE7435690.1 RNA polymerase sigma factor [Lachnospiraceae bacterium]
MDFEKLYKTYYMEVYSYVMTLMHSAVAAEEVTQEVFFKALNTRKPYRGESGEFTWLCAIAKNTCADVWKKQSRVAQFPDGMSEDAREAASAEDHVEQSVLEQMDTLRIHQILHQMEEPYKEVFQLRIFGELSFKNIGQIFGKTENWARVTYHRARLKIQERMDHDE